MFKRMKRYAALASMGLCFQLVGCQSNQVWEVIAAGTKDVASEVTGIFFNAAVDRAFGLDSQ